MTNFDIGIIVALITIFVTVIGLYQRWLAKEKRNTRDYFEKTSLLDKAILELKLKYLEFERDLIEMKSEHKSLKKQIGIDRDIFKKEMNNYHIETIKEINKIRLLIEKNIKK